MKKLLVFMLALLTVLSCASALDIDVTVSNGNFYLFDAYGGRIDLSDAKVEEGLILMTGNEWLDINCTYGKISLAPDSILNVQSLDPDHPILYLVAGEASFFPAYDFYLEVYTPVSLVSTERKGEFRIVSTSEEEKVYNMNNGDLRVLDALTGMTVVIPDLTFSDHFEDTIGDMDSLDYDARARFSEDDEAIHFFTDLGLPTLQEIEGSPLQAVLDNNWNLRIEPVVPRIPGVPEVLVNEHYIDLPPVPGTAELSVKVSSVYDPDFASVPVIENVDREMVETAPVEEVIVPEDDLVDTDAVLAEDMEKLLEEAEEITAPEVEVTEAELIPATPIELTAKKVEVTVRVPSVPELTIMDHRLELTPPTAPEMGEVIATLDRAGVPTTPRLSFYFHTPETPELYVKASVIRTGYVPTVPEIISSKSAPSFLIPNKPLELIVKAQDYKEPIVPPIVKVYEDKPGFSGWDAETYRTPAQSQAGSAADSEKKTIPTLTSSSK